MSQPRKPRGGKSSLQDLWNKPSTAAKVGFQSVKFAYAIIRKISFVENPPKEHDRRKSLEIVNLQNKSKSNQNLQKIANDERYRVYYRKVSVKLPVKTRINHDFHDFFMTRYFQVSSCFNAKRLYKPRLCRGHVSLTHSPFRNLIFHRRWFFGHMDVGDKFPFLATSLSMSSTSFAWILNRILQWFNFWSGRLSRVLITEIINSYLSCLDDTIDIATYMSIPT